MLKRIYSALNSMLKLPLKTLMTKSKTTTEQFAEDIGQFSYELSKYMIRNLHLSFIKFETNKSAFVKTLYRQRGRHAKKFMHAGMAGLSAVGMMIAPVVANEFPGRRVDPWSEGTGGSVLATSVGEVATTTQHSEKMRDKIIEYEVQDGDTVSTIANKFGVSEDTVLWENDLKSTSTIKPGQTLEILPVTGVSHKVQKGDTVYSIAKKYSTEPQSIVDFPYISFTNDETFELAIGQTIIVPYGEKETSSSSGTSRPSRFRQYTPDAGSAVASGSFVWPAQGRLTQYWSWYHKAIDIANSSAPSILAADSGTVITAGWSNVGYGYHVIIDHGNGYRTLYAHLSQYYVTPGQGVSQRDAIGRMGSTGRSTGTHLHFEVIRNGVYLNPLTVLQ